MTTRVVLLCLVAVLAGCGSKDPTLMHAAGNSTTTGPDEFSIVTNAPLEDPTSFASLPIPTPDGSNRASSDPRSDASKALGGRAIARASGLATVSPLLVHASRFGYDPDIRDRLAAEDLAYRKNNKGKLMERLFATNVYFVAYSDMSLDQYEELARMQRFGVLTPAAPPKTLPQ